MQLAVRLATEGALLAFIPIRNDIPDQTVFRAHFNLPQTFLTAILSLGPARAFGQVQRGLGEKSADGGFTRRHVDGGSFVGFGASDEALAAVSKISSYAGDCAKYEQSHRRRNHYNGDQNCSSHTSPQNQRHADV
jgi:hypothetical protein